MKNIKASIPKHLSSKRNPPLDINDREQIESYKKKAETKRRKYKNVNIEGQNTK